MNNSQKTETQYLAARREWNERYGDYIKAAHNWRLAAFGGIGVALVCSAGLVAVSLQHKVIPFAVEYNERYEPVRITRTDAMQHPTTNHISAALVAWLTGAREVSMDRRVQQTWVDRAYAMTVPDSPAYQTLVSFHKDNNPYERSQKETAQATVNTVIQISDTAWQIEWTETTKQLSGRVMDKKAWKAVVTIAIVPPSTPEQIYANPAGVYAQNFSWTPIYENK